MTRSLIRFSAVTLPIFVLGISSVAHADTIDWAHWTGSSPSAAIGSIAAGSGISVSYSGQTSGVLVNYPSWNPASTFSGGTIGNGPTAAGNSIQIEGGTNLVETITFSSALTNPVLAVESLGQPGDTASFDFTNSEPFTIEAGGPSSEYGGVSIIKSGNDVLGAEGSGVIQFTGTFTQLQFTTPVYENFYMFTVGDDVSASSPSAVTPEPGTLSLLGLGLAALPFARSRIKARRVRGGC